MLGSWRYGAPEAWIYTTEHKPLKISEVVAITFDSRLSQTCLVTLYLNRGSRKPFTVLIPCRVKRIAPHAKDSSLAVEVKAPSEKVWSVF